jgi:hypothetical protein
MAIDITLKTAWRTEMKKLLIAIPIILIVIVLVIGFSINSIVKSGIQTFGSMAMGADVRVDDVDISILSGSGKIKGVFVGNPTGFKTDSAFRLSEVRVSLDPKSLLSDRIVIDSIYINAPDITYEKGMSGDNIQALLNNIRKYSGTSGGRKKESAGKDGGKEKKVVISDLLIQNGKINLSMAALQGKKVTLDMPEIHMTDIGKDDKNATLSDVMGKIFAVVNQNIVSTAAGSVKEIGKSVEKQVRGSVEKSIGGSVNKLKGLFGK